MLTQTHSQIALDARQVVTEPERFASHPSLRLLAWATLKAARGQTVCQRRQADAFIELDNLRQTIARKARDGAAA